MVIARPRDELFQYWRRFENLPRFMDNLESVTMLDGRRSHWVAKGPLGARVEWDAEIHNEIPDELLAWRSLPGSEVDQAGSVHFTPAEGGGTEVRVVLRYTVPGGKVGDAVAHLLGSDPERQDRGRPPPFQAGDGSGRRAQRLLARPDLCIARPVRPRTSRTTASWPARGPPA